MSHGNRKTIENEGFRAFQEYIASCTVLIWSEKDGFQHGSGVAVRYAEQDYILTAAHVLEGEPDNNKILVVGRPDAPLKEVDKGDLEDAVFRGTYGRIESSTAKWISIIDRMIHGKGEDIAALKVQNAKESLPNTVFHDLSGQEEHEISDGVFVYIYGYPGELAQQVELRKTGQQGPMVFLHLEERKIKAIPDALDELDPDTHFVTDFSFDENTCDPHGMSGCGIWSFPKFNEEELWLPNLSKLLGIQSGWYRDSKLLAAVRIKQVWDLLDRL